MHTHYSLLLWSMRAFGLVLLVTLTQGVIAAPQLIVPSVTGPTKRATGIGSTPTAVILNRNQLQLSQAGDQLEFTLPSARTYRISIDGAVDHGSGIASWVGHLAEFGRDYRVIITNGPGGTFGRIRTPEGDFRLVPGEGHDWLVNMVEEQQHLPLLSLADDIMIPPLHSAPPEPQQRFQPTFAPTETEPSSLDGILRLSTPGSTSKAAPSPQAVVDIMFVYTAGWANSLGGNLMTRLFNLVTTANTAYADSEVAITLRLVNAVQVNYPDDTATASNSRALRDITPGTQGGDEAAGGLDPLFSNIEALRNSNGADMVAFLRGTSGFGGSGVAWLGSSSPNANFMYSVSTGCLLGCESLFIHEVGHNMGNAHDRATAAFQDGGVANPSGGAYTYSFGFFHCETGLNCNPNLPPGSGGCSAEPVCASSHANNFGTIMSYINPTVLKFSNPGIMCQPPGGAARACGVAAGQAGEANNALSMNNNRIALSALRGTVTSTPHPGSLQFTASSFNATEAGGTAQLTVSRVGAGAGAGAVSVSYSTSDGNAVAGLDYVSTSGTLSWGVGDVSNKTINVSIVNDGLTEISENFSVTLSNPTGTAGVFLGSPAVASVIIQEPWPAGNTIPSGFSTSSSHSNPGANLWTAVTDQVFEGTHSLRSGQVLTGDGSFSTTLNSDLTFTGSLAGGTVAFAYRVSSYQNFGNFDFIVNGVTVLTDTGETGWKNFSISVPSGNNTLVWRFRNRMPSACNAGWNPPAQGGAACADRVWIDAVALPLTLSPASVALSSSQNPSVSGQAVTFTASVSGGAGTPTGFAVFRDGQSIISGCNSVNLVSGQAQCTNSSLPIGSRSITAQYSGSAVYSATTSSALSQTVNGGATPPKKFDFNADSRSDILWRNAGNGQNYLYPMNGTAILPSEGFIRSVPAPWTVAGVGDFDGDGRADILWRNTSTGENYMYPMNGTTILGTEGFIRSVPTVWTVGGIGDFDGDGKADILWRNTSTGENYLYFMDGRTIKATEGFIRSVPTVWIPATVADFDGDGKADILWRHTGTGENYMYPMDGKTIKATEGFIRSVPTNWIVGGSGDFDGDGKGDLLWRNTTTGENYLYFMDGRTIKPTEGFIRSVPTVWTAASVADFDGDGKADILWRNTSTGENYIYPMDGRVIKATEGFTRSVPTSWSVVSK